MATDGVVEAVGRGVGAAEREADATGWTTETGAAAWLGAAGLLGAADLLGATSLLCEADTEGRTGGRVAEAEGAALS